LAGSTALPLRAVVVGTGWGRHHAEGYSQADGVEFAGFCVRTASERSVAAARRFNVPLFVGLENMLAEVRPDLVSVATREPEHRAVTVAALEAGAHVYCEKALAETVEDAAAMVEAARRADRQLMAGYNYRFSPSMQHLRSVVDRGRLGVVLYAQALTFGYCLHHTLDLLCSFLGEVDELFATFRAEGPAPTAVPTQYIGDWCYSAGASRTIHLRFRSGAVAQLASSDYQLFGHPAVRIDLGGTEARAQVDDIVGRVTVHRGERTAELWQPSLIRDRLDLGSTAVAAVGAFAAAVRAGQPVPIPGEQGLRMLRIERACVRSQRLGQPVGVDEA
jgi:predicted dehydrogenase